MQRSTQSHDAGDLHAFIQAHTDDLRAYLFELIRARTEPIG